MSVYFEQVEQELRGALRRQAHLPWYVRLRLRRPRALIAALTCLVIAAPALAAAAGAFETGTPVGPPVPAIANAFDGVALPGSVDLLPLRVADPDGGPPWAIRSVKTTRGLECLQLGRYVNGTIGVLGTDGAFANDGRFHPLSSNVFEFTFSCGALDGGGHAFINEADTAIPTSALANANTSAGGCYQVPVRLDGHARPVCPKADLRDVFFGLLGPDATSLTYRTASGALINQHTSGPGGAYLIVIEHSGGIGGETGGPTLSSGVDTSPIQTVNYTAGRVCNLTAPLKHLLRSTAAWRRALDARFPTLAKALKNAAAQASAPGFYIQGDVPKRDLQEIRAIVRSPAYQRFVRTHRDLLPKTPPLARSSCPAVGYVAPHARLLTHAQVAAPISARVESSRSYCVSPTEIARPCAATVPPGYRRVPRRVARRNVLLVVTWTSRVAVTNQDAHYEVYNTNIAGNYNDCAGGGTSFGPTQTNLRAGQRAIFTTWMPRQCMGTTHGSVDFVQDTGPAGSIPVPAQPGEGPDIPVGTFTATVP
jgi:hypothetical protein